MSKLVYAEIIKKKIRPPDDYIKEHGLEEAERKFLVNIRKEFNRDLTTNEENRKEAFNDFDFIVGNQWYPENEQERKKNGLPCLVINRLQAYLSTILGHHDTNETVIKVHPDHGGSKDIAELRQGLIRSIEKNSNAKHAYSVAHKNQVICGDGAFMIDIEYLSDDIFEQEIVFKPIDNFNSVVWDYMSIDPTGKDASHVFITSLMCLDEFKRIYPNADTTNFDSSEYRMSHNHSYDWVTEDTVRVASYYRMRWRDKRIAMMKDGVILDITDMNEGEILEISDNIAESEDGELYVRDCKSPYVEKYIINGIELLDGPFVYDISRLPVFRCVGWEIIYGDNRVRYGFVRSLKDPQRMHNYTRSVSAEQLMSAPKNKWLASASSVAGKEDDYRNSATSYDPLLTYNPESPLPPQYISPPPINEALMNEAGVAVQDLRDITNLHEASLGQKSNEVSGEAIRARQKIGETSIQMYQKNHNMAVEECGKVLNELITYIYDTKRMIKVIGDNDEEIMQVINSDANNDITLGRYSVTVATGPSYVTKRAEAAQAMMNMINAMPETMMIAADKIIEAQDWPGADDIAARIRSQLPPGVLSEKDMSDEEKAKMQQQQQQQQQQMEFENEMKVAELEYKQAQVQESLSRSEQADAYAEKARAEIGEGATQSVLNIAKARRESKMSDNKKKEK